jgi:cbb3-type cytochrome oxidase maturation protein
MSIIYMLLAVSVIVALVFFVAFIVSVRAGQYDDTYTPSVRMLFDDELVKEETSQVSSRIAAEPKKKPINIK